MGVRALHDGITGTACMYDSVSGFAFGPLFYDNDVTDDDAGDLVDAFVEWCGDDDPRTWSDDKLEQHAIAFLRQRELDARAAQNASFT